MKKYSLLKIIGLMFLVVVVLSWIIPIGSYSSGVFVKGEASPIGILDLFRVPLMTIANLLQYGLVIVLIGGLYGILNKTGAYSNLVEKFVKKLKGKEKLFLIITICTLALLNSVLGIPYALLILVPFIITIIRKLGFDKITALVSTIGAILIGNVGAIYGNDTSLYLNTYFSLGINDEIFTKIIFLIIITFLLVMFVLKRAQLSKNNSKNKKEEVIEDIPLYEVNNKKKSVIPLIVIFSLCFIFLLINMFNWSEIFGITYFTKMYEKMTSVSILSNIIGTVSIFGTWTPYDMCIFLILMTVIVGWIYSVKFEEMVDGFTSGVKQVLAPAFYAVIANIIFVTLYRLQTNSNIYLTISDFLFNLAGGAKVFMVPLVSLIGGFFFNDVASLTAVLASPIQVLITDTTKYQIIAMMIQSIHGIVMLLLPTSILLVTGLSYLKISFKEWFKYIWKYLIQILIIAIIIILIMALFV